MKSIKKADGVSGFVLRDCKGYYFFRIYKKEGDFKDYKIGTEEIPVTISKKSFLSFYEKENLLDHSPEVLRSQK